MTQLHNNFLVLPSVLSSDFGKLADEANDVDIPEIEFLHVDVMDGHFVPNLTIGAQVVEALKKHTRFKLDVHLMIENAPNFIKTFADAGADNITIHQEAVTHLDNAIHKIKDLGSSAGVTINPATSVENIRWILSEVDLVLIMSVNPGFGGQKFISSSIDRIKYLSKMREEMKTDFVIEVDGGIDPATAADVFLAGARYLVSGSYIFKQTDRPSAIRKIIKSVKEAETRQSSRLV